MFLTEVLSAECHIHEDTSKLTATVTWSYQNDRTRVDRWIVRVRNLTWEQNDCKYVAKEFKCNAGAFTWYNVASVCLEYCCALYIVSLPPLFLFPPSLSLCVSVLVLTVHETNKRIYRFIVCLDSLDILQNKSRPIYILPVDYVLYCQIIRIRSKDVQTVLFSAFGQCSQWSK